MVTQEAGASEEDAERALADSGVVDRGAAEGAGGSGGEVAWVYFLEAAESGRRVGGEWADKGWCDEQP